MTVEPYSGLRMDQNLIGMDQNLIAVLEWIRTTNDGIKLMTVEPYSGFAQRTFIRYAETFGPRFVQGRVERVDTERQTVVLQGGREIRYSHLVLCTGTDGPFPGKFNTEASVQTAVRAYEDFVTQVQAAGSVLVVGGGSTGVEMAAEIKTEYPDKKVVLIHSKTALADPELLPSVRQQAKQVLLDERSRTAAG
ncbi:apoptosis-inducing factor 2 [Scomber scombrus]|uniref:Ferroptosis suppressor protein 1 n=1 Tax=Scomber scombrus TaxID=13677 RepID=A0AAV1QIB6_SCOSC